MIVMVELKKLIQALRVIKQYAEFSEPQTLAEAKAQIGLIKMICGEALIAAEAP